MGRLIRLWKVAPNLQLKGKVQRSDQTTRVANVAPPLSTLVGICDQPNTPTQTAQWQATAKA